MEKRTKDCQMVGMDEALVADWFVVTRECGGRNGETESNQARRAAGLGVAWQVIGKNGSHGVQLKE